MLGITTNKLDKVANIPRAILRIFAYNNFCTASNEDYVALRWSRLFIVETRYHSHMVGVAETNQYPVRLQKLYQQMHRFGTWYHLPH